jgi:hypothetical protein
MIGNRYSGDNIAADFFRLVKKGSPQAEEPEVVASEVAVTAEADNSEVKEVSAKDFLLRKDNTESNGVIDELENSIDDFNQSEVLASVENSDEHSLAPSRRTIRILSGLGKIAASVG